jgi:hypothetical protein
MLSSINKISNDIQYFAILKQYDHEFMIVNVSLTNGEIMKYDLRGPVTELQSSEP